VSGTVSQDPSSPDQAGGAASPKTVFANERDRHLFGPGPKRILALDGGGVRGAITVAFLERIETLLSQKHGPNVRLCDHFDLIGGTSTGAIIGGALALGKSTKQVEDFYLKLAPQVFSRPHWRRLFFLRAKFDARRLRREIDEVVGDLVLESSELATGFALIAKRMDTGSPWIIANNPRAPYWEDSKDHIGNRHYPLSKLVRASTAAPHFFDPEFLRIVPDDVPPDEVAKLVDRSLAARFISALLVLARLRRPMTGISKTHGIFVDGGVTPHGNPALALLQMATLKPFGICWPASPDRLTVVSIGTGSHRPQLAYESLGFAGSLRLAYRSLLSMMNDSQWLVLALMQWMGECLTPWQINSEIGSLCDSSPPGGKMFRFVRYDVRLERDWLTRELGREVSAEKIERYRCIDDPGVVDELYEIGQIIAERQVKPEHWID
jgi:Patatin-like phospholipase